LKMENKDRPDWADVSIENVKLKKYWSQWDRILLINNVLIFKLYSFSKTKSLVWAICISSLDLCWNQNIKLSSSKDGVDFDSCFLVLYRCSMVIVRTDHGSLTWLLRFKNPEGQMARWLQMLNTYNFEIIHRPGRQHGNAGCGIYPLSVKYIID
jgi:hypothetical protein